MRAMANVRRRALMELLSEGEKSVNDLAAHFDVARPAISRHLRVLREAGLVQYRSEHNVRYYSLRQPEIERLQDTLNETFSDYWSPQGSQDSIAGVESAIRSFHEVRIVAELPISVLLAYRYCTEPALFRKWIGDDAENDARAGGHVKATSAFGGELHAEYLALEPARFLALRVTMPLSPDENFYTIRFEDAAKGSRVVLTHYLADRDAAKLVATAWSETLALLRKKADPEEG